MKRRTKWLLAAAGALALVFVADYAATQFVHSQRVQKALTARLAATFGRPVQVSGYDFSLWDGPRIEADSVTVGEDPRFGNEYFLRAALLEARLRLRSLLLGRVEFGSFSLSQPNLNVVNVGGRWNLADWLPPAMSGRPGARTETPRLYRISIDGGRINFKRGPDKLPFALVDVSGSVDERSPGRWAISLEAQPLRAAVNLQDAGTLYLAGEVGGTSSRLRPADLYLRWEDASLSDVLRLAFGYDYGVRGRQDLDLRANSSGDKWFFELDARDTGVHAWDLAVQSGNPAVNVRLAGEWSPGEAKLTLAGGQIAAPSSFVGLSGVIEWPIVAPGQPRATSRGPEFQLHLTSAGVSAQDLLSWYRSFRPGISPALEASGWIEGSLDFGGWPPGIRQSSLQAAGLRIDGGELRAPVEINTANLDVSNGKAKLALSGLDFGPRLGRFQVTGNARYGTDRRWRYKLAASGASPHLGELVSAVEVLGVRPAGYWRQFEGSGKIGLDWSGTVRPFERDVRASIDLSDAVWREPSLPARVRIEDARLKFSRGLLRLDVARAQALGATWRGWLERRPPDNAWRFDLDADRVDARSLAAKLSPRPERPSLLERIFGFGHAAGSPPLWPASLDASGKVRIGRLLAAPVEFDQVSGKLEIQQGALDLSGAEARFYGGRAGGSLGLSVEKRMPAWRLDARLDRVELDRLSRAIEEKSPRFGGTVSGTVTLAARGATAASLLGSLSGSGKISIHRASDRLVDWLATLEAGRAVRGASSFSEAQAQIHLAAGKLTFDDLSLFGPRGHLQAAGALDLAHGAALEVVARVSRTRRGPPLEARFYRVTGSAADPRAELRPAATPPSSAPQPRSPKN
ncbi:MAG: AsmA family protein [Acidobacteriota bacterium]|nr:AsmA family protein [Acidobacteriota bacterium]